MSNVRREFRSCLLKPSCPMSMPRRVRLLCFISCNMLLSWLKITITAWQHQHNSLDNKIKQDPAGPCVASSAALPVLPVLYDEARRGVKSVVALLSLNWNWELRDTVQAEEYEGKLSFCESPDLKPDFAPPSPSLSSQCRALCRHTGSHFLQTNTDLIPLSSLNTSVQCSFSKV